ncbi:MAG: gliding-motility protein MglA [Polyangiales bacterium]
MDASNSHPTPPDALRPGHREVDIVLHGPGLGGKATNLLWIFHRTAPEARGAMQSLATASERELSLRLYPRTFCHPSGEPLCVRLRTVPGAVYYSETGPRLLCAARGVIFVADSQVERREANVESLEELARCLAAAGRDVRRVPLVLQYNKRDLRNRMAVERMDADLAPRGAPRLTAVAHRGVEVFPTLKACVRLVLAAERAAPTR